jgi:hypothetical protein
LTERERRRPGTQLGHQDIPAQRRPTVEVDDDYDEVELERTAIDPYGRRSTAYLLPKTGQVLTYTGHGRVPTSQS